MSSCPKNERPVVCCIPSLDSDDGVECGDNNQHSCRYNLHADSIGGSPENHSMAIRSGPYGRHAIASRNLKAGSLIVQCLPLAHSILLPPGALMEEDGGDDDDCGGKRRCTRCFFQEGDEDSSGMRRKKFGRCSKCHVAYYCSRSCQADDWNEQHKLECQYYVKRRKQSSNYQLYASSPEEDVIPLLLRTFHSLKFLRDNMDVPTKLVDPAETDGADNQQGDIMVSCGPDHFSSLMVSPEHHTKATTGKSVVNSSSMVLAKNLMESFSSKHTKKASTETKTAATLNIWGYGSNNDNNDEALDYTTDRAIHRTMNAFQKNNFGIVNSLFSPVGEGVYPCAALLNHSCSPNCILRYKLGVANNSGGHYPPILQIIACRDIVLGEELCHSYVDLALCTEERQGRLLGTHGFVCECIRCKKGGCTTGLPQNWEEWWDLWPLTHGGNCTMPSLEQVDIDDAITGCQGLSETELTRILEQSRVYREKANQSMLAGDSSGELHNLHEAIKLYTVRGDDGKRLFSPFHGQLYSLRCSYLSALLAIGDIHQALEQCEHITSFLAVSFSHVQNHPLLGLQLYTLGDLYATVATMEVGSLANEKKSLLTEKSKLAYAWAKRVMVVTHGANDLMVQTLEDNLSNNADL
ncbi:hypothetical protein ACHAXR_010804 [Thalassiosira sp. AJA248-18]